MSRLPRHVHAGDREHLLGCDGRGEGRFELRIDGDVYEVVAGALDESGFWFVDPGGRKRFAYAAPAGDDLHLRLDGTTYLLRSAERVHGNEELASDPTRVTAPMTGTIVKVLTTAGASVAAGDDLIVLTAMKMEHRLQARAAGKVAEIGAAEGDTVDEGALLVRLDPE